MGCCFSIECQNNDMVLIISHNVITNADHKSEGSFVNYYSAQYLPSGSHLEIMDIPKSLLIFIERVA